MSWECFRCHHHTADGQTHDCVVDELEALQKKCEIYEWALEYYANEENYLEREIQGKWGPIPFVVILQDGFDVARLALAEGKEK